MKNRHGEEWYLSRVEDNTYKIIPPNQWWRAGSKVGQEMIDYSDLGFVDWSGGPFIEVGMEIGISEVLVKKIYCKQGDIFLEVN